MLHYHLGIIAVVLLGTTFGIASDGFNYEEEAPTLQDCAELLFGDYLEQQDAIRTLEIALEFLKKSSRQNRRASIHDDRATRLIELMTGSSGVTAQTFAQPAETPEVDYCEIDVGPKRRAVSASTMRNILAMVDAKKSVRTIQAKYAWYRPVHATRLRACLEAGTTHGSLTADINNHTLAMIRHHRSNHRAIRGWMIQNWAMARARQIGAYSFTASPSWLYYFQKRNRIVSRHVTDRTGRAQQRNENRTRESMLDFREAFALARQNYSDSLIWNFDQSPNQYEFSVDRTLSFEGERDTIVGVDQASKVSHTYTIQPIVSRDGRAIGKLLICLQEPGGTFGPRVSQEVENMEVKYRNIAVMASSSGKMTIEHMRQWVRRVVIPSLTGRGAAYPVSADHELDEAEISSTPVDISESPSSSQSTVSESPMEPVAGTSGLNLRPRSRVLLLGDL